MGTNDRYVSPYLRRPLRSHEEAMRETGRRAPRSTGPIGQRPRGEPSPKARNSAHGECASGGEDMSRGNESAGPRDPGPGHPPSHAGSGPAAIEARLARLAEMATRDLRAEWQRLYRAEPPARLSRDLLIRAVAYKIQERANGGPNAALRRRLRTLAEQLAAGNDLSGSTGAMLKPGARLVREWRGRTHTVTVIDAGFEYDGQRYRSLSQIAKAITGVHRSGPRFFGLTKANGKSDSPDGSIPGNVAAPGE